MRRLLAPGNGRVFLVRQRARDVCRRSATPGSRTAPGAREQADRRAKLSREPLHRRAQAFALPPGISRSGSSMVAGLLCDLDHEHAARFSFLLATPVIGAAALLELRDSLRPHAHLVSFRPIVGGIAAGIAAYLSVAFFDALFPLERSSPVRLVLRDPWFHLFRACEKGSHHMRGSRHRFGRRLFRSWDSLRYGTINSLRNREPRTRTTSPTRHLLGSRTCSP